MMKFSFLTEPVVELTTDLLGIPVFEGMADENGFVALVDRGLDGLLTQVMAEEGFSGKEKDNLLIHTRGSIKPARVMLVGLGARDDFDLPDTIRFGARVAREADSRGCRSIAISLPSLDSSSFGRAAQFIAQGVTMACYRFDRYLSKDRRKPSVIEQLDIAVEKNGLDSLSMARGELVAQGICLARDLVNEPPTSMTPRLLADAARNIAKQQGLDCKVFGPKECEKLGMKLLLAVGQGSSQEPRLIHLTYQPKGRETNVRSYALVGKGITFDAGGLSLKTSSTMESMKCDMAGAAAVLGAMSVLPTLGLKAEVHALIAAAENMPSGNAYHPGDVVVGLGGKSVEIINTDAEGRLVLADALAYAAGMKVNEIIDVATLTGACEVALGPFMAGVMGNDRGLAERFTAAARRVGEEVWQLPLPRNLKYQLDSEIADLKNIGKREGGALTAGLFLKEFVGETPWIHLDIAGPAYAEEAKPDIDKGGTGYGVASLVEYLTSREGLS